MVYIFYPSAAFLPHQIRLSGAKPPFTLIFQQRKIQENRADKNRGVLFPYQIQNHINSTLQSKYSGVTFKYRGVRYFLRTLLQYSTVQRSKNAWAYLSNALPRYYNPSLTLINVLVSVWNWILSWLSISYINFNRFMNPLRVIFRRLNRLNCHPHL